MSTTHKACSYCGGQGHNASHCTWPRMPATQPTYQQLVAAQMREWPDSHIVPETEALGWAMRSEWNSTLFRAAMQHPVRVFYQCGIQEDGSYRWLGCRFGVDGADYISNWDKD